MATLTKTIQRRWILQIKLMRMSLKSALNHFPVLQMRWFQCARRLASVKMFAFLSKMQSYKKDAQLTKVQKLMAQHPLPVVVCSSHVSANSEILVKARLAGAVDVICKPQMAAGEFFDAQRTAICNALRNAAQAKVKGASFTKSEPKLTADVMVRPPKPGAAPFATWSRCESVATMFPSIIP